MWYVSGMTQRGTQLRISSFAGGSSVLSHEGTYQCMATTQKGTILSQEATLTRAGEQEEGMISPSTLRPLEKLMLAFHFLLLTLRPQEAPNKQNQI